MSKYIFIRLTLRSGEDEFDQTAVLEISPRKNAYKAAREYLKDFWGEAEESGDPEDEWVEYPNGIIGKVKAVQEITKEHYDILSKYI